MPSRTRAPSRPVTIALIGADGSGKTTIARRLAAALPATYIYMGTNPASASHELPTTRFLRAARRRLGRAQPYLGGPPSRTAPGRKSVARRLRSAGHLLKLMTEEVYRQALIRRAARRGETVIIDRHFYFDYFAHHVTGDRTTRTLAERAHGWLLRRLARPDIVILLDAPADILYRRKPEGSMEDLVSRRREYLDIADRFPAVRIVDATLSLGAVEAEVRRTIMAELGP